MDCLFTPKEEIVPMTPRTASGDAVGFCCRRPAGASPNQTHHHEGHVVQEVLEISCAKARGRLGHVGQRHLKFNRGAQRDLLSSCP
mmetsp:Transcript_77667/g.180165  ORF Transcript_77667/g.180165 Transcript_77667/m.180165 type:complete len:86 (-) Transcript_77667:92-349(-)